MSVLLLEVAPGLGADAPLAARASVPIAEKMAAARTRVMRTLQLFRFIILRPTPSDRGSLSGKALQPAGWRRRTGEKFLRGPARTCPEYPPVVKRASTDILRLVFGAGGRGRGGGKSCWGAPRRPWAEFPVCGEGDETVFGGGVGGGGAQKPPRRI